MVDGSGVQTGDRGFDLAGFGKSAETLFREHEGVVGCHFEDAPGALDQFGAGTESLFEIGRQTGSSGFVVSNNAVFNRQSHGDLFFRFFRVVPHPMIVNSLCVAGIPAERPLVLNDARTIFVDPPEMQLC